jgi:hypothetical protein
MTDALTRAAALRNLGFSERFLSTFWIPFFSAVFLDPPLEVTTRMFNFVFRSIAGESVLVPIRQRLGDLESIFTLNEVATCVWERLAAPASFDEIVGVIEEQFDETRDAIRQDAEEFLQTLLTLGAIRPVEIPDSTVRE